MVVKDRALYARVSDPLVTAPPSAVVRFFVGKKENVVKSAIEPTARPRYRDQSSAPHPRSRAADGDPRPCVVHRGQRVSGVVNGHDCLGIQGDQCLGVTDVDVSGIR